MGYKYYNQNKVQRLILHYILFHLHLIDSWIYSKHKALYKIDDSPFWSYLNKYGQIQKCI